MRANPPIAETMLDAPTRASTCVVGGHQADRAFRFARGVPEPQTRCLRHSLSFAPLVRTAAATALVVGTVLTVINQGNIILGGEFPTALFWKIPLTYSVPYMVATWSAMRMAHVR